MNALPTESAWDAIVARDAAADGRFVFAVKTTGVYCKPSCPARRPLRANVEIFPAPSSAEMRGYRACLRCKPKDEPWVARACAYLSQNVERRVSLDELAEHLQLSSFHVQRAFKAALGVSPRAYVAALRQKTLRAALPKTSVTRAIVDAGYASPSRVEDLGMPASTFARGGGDVEVRYAIATCALGSMLVARTERGLCAVHLGDGAAKVEALLRAELPRATLVRDDRGLGRLVRDVASLLDGGSPALPLDVRATAFQRRVYELLRSIPRGETVTYTQLAERLGAPHAVRAVARACATNSLALVIPCHRVVRKDGELAGYRWGLARKRKLLAREAQRQSTT